MWDMILSPRGRFLGGELQKRNERCQLRTKLISWIVAMSSTWRLESDISRKSSKIIRSPSLPPRSLTTPLDQAPTQTQSRRPAMMDDQLSMEPKHLSPPTDNRQKKQHGTGSKTIPRSLTSSSRTSVVSQYKVLQTQDIWAPHLGSRSHALYSLQ